MSRSQHMDNAMTSVGMSWLIVHWWWHNKNESRMGGGRLCAYTDWHNGLADARGQRTLENHNSCKYGRIGTNLSILRAENCGELWSVRQSALKTLECSKAERQQIRIIALNIPQCFLRILLSWFTLFSFKMCFLPLSKLDFHISHLFKRLYLPKDGHNLSFI